MSKSRTATAVCSTSFSCCFPSELRDHVIDQLHDNRPALKACSLTCRTWLRRARYHLFSRVAFDSGQTGDAFGQLVRSSPTIIDFIQEVELCGTPVHTWWNTKTPAVSTIAWPTLDQTPRHRKESDVVETALWLQRILPSSTPPFSRLVSLKLSSLPISDTVTHALHCHFKNTTTLTLDGCKALALADFMDLLCAFPRLNTLRVLAAQWLPAIHCKAEKCAGSLPRLRRLEMSRKIDAAPLISRILTESAHSDIVSLSCSVSGHNCAHAIRDFLHAARSSLEQLEIGFQDSRDPTDVLQTSQLDLTQSTGLRRLRISCSASHCLMPSSYRPSLSWIVILLSTASSSQLQELVFSIRSADLCALNMEGLDVVLSGTRYTSLKSVKFEILLSGQALGGMDHSWIRNRMPAIRMKGILSISSDTICSV
ncbi:uncharacterized protein FIBRA_03434 [Fibroporia radiculosa]|uniref:F-box domain-containing protein n=1 Tax=Fibroporia radiculosa TaxID=599839 RepID=J4G5I0_9APHY|nr:uncharacterized protein FIBRA_03434 [Fibroporia radiculosa]CCM01383.1 predicted protein [Fibroporia radiculosa]